MNGELKSHIKKLQTRAVFSLVAMIGALVSCGFGILFLFVPSFVAVLFFAIAVVCVIYLVYAGRRAKKEANESFRRPVIVHADKPISFEALVGSLETMTDQENQLSASEDVRFFRLEDGFKCRIVLYRTADFDKTEFDTAKDRINKKANKALQISQWVNRDDARRRMRLNVICAHSVNDALYRFLSQNANRNLTRVEGILNLAVVGNQIMIPPLYGECDPAEISRYKRTIRFIEQVMLNQ